MKTTANDPPPNQFSLKRMFVTTGLMAGFVLAWKYESFTAWFISYLISCFAIAFTGIGQKTGPVWRGTIAGALIPAGFFAAIFPYVDEHSTIDAMVFDIVFGSMLIASFGAFYGAFAGVLLSPARPPSSTNTPPD